MWKRSSINKYTIAGRAEIHKNLKGINIDNLLYLMRNPISDRSIEYNDNRIALYAGQMGKCAITGRKLELSEIHCHHKKPRSLVVNNMFANLFKEDDVQ